MQQQQNMPSAFNNYKTEIWQRQKIKECNLQKQNKMEYSIILVYFYRNDKIYIVYIKGIFS